MGSTQSTWGVRRMPLERIEVLTTAGENVPLYLEPSKTVKDLKEAVDEKIGVDPANQKVSVLGYPLDDDNMKLEELLYMSHTFNVSLPDTSGNKGRGANRFMSDREVFLINGKRFDFQAIQLFARQVEKIKLKSNKFGLVRHVEGEVGKRIFHLRKYVVDKEIDNESRIETRTGDDNQQRVYLITGEKPNGKETELEVQKHTTYNETKEGNKIASYFKKVTEFFD